MESMIKSISLKNLRPKLPAIMKDIQSKMDRFIVTKRGVPVAVMMSPNDYESLVETLKILSNRSFLDRIKASQKDHDKHRTKSLDQLEKELKVV